MAVNIGNLVAGESEIELSYISIPALKGEKGDTGRGISSVIKTSTVGLVDTWTITYTDGSTSSFDVTNGADGDDYVITSEDYQEIADIVEEQIEIPSKTSDLINDSDFVSDNSYVHTDNNYTTTEKNKLASLSNYDDTEIKQDITNLETTKADKSEIPDVSNFITKNVNDLTNYYSKSETYTKQEVDGKVSSVYKYKGSVATYQDLPSTSLTIGDVYNVESTGDNYAWTGTTWDKLGGEIDLSEYYTKTQTDNLLEGKADTEDIPDLTDYVKNTDYATANVGGVVKVAEAGLGIGVSADGVLLTRNEPYNTYLKKTSFFAISKGTLENVITGKNLESANNKTTTISSSSTDNEYPSAKAVYNLIGDIESALETLDEGSGV